MRKWPPLDTLCIGDGDSMAVVSIAQPLSGARSKPGRNKRARPNLYRALCARSPRMSPRGVDRADGALFHAFTSRINPRVIRLLRAKRMLILRPLLSLFRRGYFKDVSCGCLFCVDARVYIRRGYFGARSQTRAHHRGRWRKKNATRRVAMTSRN